MPSSSKLLIAAVAIGALASAAAAQPAKRPAAKSAAAGGVTPDVRCLMTMLAVAQSKNGQEPGRLGVYYFAGRIAARAPGYDLATAIKAQAPSLTGPQIETELKRCAALVQGSMQSVQTALASLRPPGAPAGPPPAGAIPAAPAPAAPAPAAPAPK